MERGSNKHSPRVDEQMGAEVRGIVQGTAGARAEEWKLAEPSGEDQPDVSAVPAGSGRGEPGGVGNADAERFSRFGSYLGRSALPGDRDALVRGAQALEAPDDVLRALRRLPPHTTYRTAAEVWAAVRG
jgi:hypothetical protein